MLLPDADGNIQDPTHFCDRGVERVASSLARYPVPGNDLGIAQWAYDHRQKAGMATDTLASAGAIYLPLNALKRCIGVLGLRPLDPRQLQIPEQMHLVEALVNQAAVAMERVQLDRDGARSARAGRIRTRAQRAAERDFARLPHAAGDHHRFRVDLARQRAGAPRRRASARPCSTRCCTKPNA